MLLCPVTNILPLLDTAPLYSSTLSVPVALAVEPSPLAIVNDPK